MIKTIETKLYNELVDLATRQLNIYEHIDPMDVVNDVIVTACEFPEFVDEADLRNMLWQEIRAVGVGRKGQLNPRERFRLDKSYVCGACHETLPTAAFYFVKRKKTDQLEVLMYCIECHKKYVAEYKRKNKYAINLVLYNKAYRMRDYVKKKKNEFAKKWQKENKEKWKEYQREWSRKKRALEKEKKLIQGSL